MNFFTSKENVEPCCTWKEESNCEDCTLESNLDCKWDKKLLMRFLYAMLPAFVFIVVGTIWGAIKLTNWWWFAIIVGYYTLFFLVETRILCSHCPYYSEEGKILHCLANHGFIKYVRYRPEPISRIERNILRVGFIFFAAVPLSNQIINVVTVAIDRSSFTPRFYIGLWVILGLTILTITIAFSILFFRICPRCVNFSCPFNKVSKEKVDEYLRKNPTMLNAWISNGYKISEESER